MNQARRYSSLDELEDDFRRQIETVDDPVEKADLRVAKAEAQVAFKQQEAQSRELNAYKRLAMVEYPNAAKFPELVSGSNEQEIMQSAKEAHERLSSLADGTAGASAFDQFRDNARDQNPYGRAGVIGGGATPGSSHVSPDMAEARWNHQFAQRFNDAPRDAYGTRLGINPADVNRYTTNRFVDHVRDRVSFWGRMTNSSYRG